LDTAQNVSNDVSKHIFLRIEIIKRLCKNSFIKELKIREITGKEKPSNMRGTK